MSVQCNIIPNNAEIKRKPNNNYVDNTERQLFQYQIIYKYLDNITSGKKITDFLISLNCTNIVLYAETEFMKLIYNNIITEQQRKKSIYIYGLSDHKIDHDYIENQIQFLSYSSMVANYHQNRFDKIINCSIFHENEIVNCLLMDNIKQDDILSVYDCIYYM